MAKITVTDAEVKKILRRYGKDPSHNELKRAAQRLGITRAKGSGAKTSQEAARKLARQIAEHEKRNRLRTFQLKQTPEQKKILSEQRKLRAAKLAKTGSGLKKAIGWAGKKIPFYYPVRALEQASEKDVIPLLGKGRESTFESFAKKGIAVPFTDKRFGRGDPTGILQVAKALPFIGDPVGAMSSFYQAGPRAVKGLDEILGDPDTPFDDSDKALTAAQIKVRDKADTNDDGKISGEERAAALKEIVPMLGGTSVIAMDRGRRAAAGEKYLADVPADLRPSGDDKWFYGGAGDTEFEDAEEEAIFGQLKDKLRLDVEDKEGRTGLPPKRVERLREQRKGTLAVRKAEEERGKKVISYEEEADPARGGKKFAKGLIYKPATKEYFDADDRAAFLKAAKDGTLVEMFDTDDSGGLSRSEKALYFDKTRGFKAGGPIAAREAAAAKAASDLIPAPEPELEMVTDPVSGAEYPAEAGSMPPVDPREALYGVDPDTGDPDLLPAAPPTTRDYADMMRHTIDTATDIGERNDTMREIRESMVKQKLTTPEEFNQIGSQMLEEAPARKAAAHVAYLRSREGSEWVDTPGLDALAALQKAPFGRGTALEGSVGGLKDASRQLESIGGRQRRKARELEGGGYRREAGATRAGAPRRPLMSQRDRLELEEKKRRNQAKLEAMDRPIIREGEENIKANTIS